MERKELIRTIYLYLFSLVGLVLVVIGCVQFVDLGLKTYVFTKANQAIVYPTYPMTKIGPMGDLSTEPLTEEEIAQYEKQQQEVQQKQQESDQARTAAGSLAMIIIGIPLFFYHWILVRKDKEKNLKNSYSKW